MAYARYVTHHFGGCEPRVLHLTVIDAALHVTGANHDDRSRGRPTVTAPPLPPGPSGNRALRVLLLAGVAVAVVVALVVAVALLPTHHKSATAPAAPASTDASPTQSPSASTSSGSSSSASESASSTPSVASTAPGGAVITPGDSASAVKQQVIAAYLLFERTLNQQLSVIAADMSPLLGVATGQVLTNSENAVAKLRGKGEVQRGNPTFTDVSVTSMPAATTAIVCAVEDDSPTQIVSAKTGAVVASGFQRYYAHTTMVLDQGVWKASVATSGGSC
jgi:hypothetical protein